ncbi:8019_t:CDS:2, partial [Scutellospora calospora]
LLVASQYQPESILDTLVPYLAGSRPIIIYHINKEVLVNTCVHMRISGKFLNPQLTEGWLREYQVLPGRTHPSMSTSGGGGYLLQTIYTSHRSSSCNHQDRQLIEIKRKGRPITQCDHCRELRKTHKIHVKCNCNERASEVIQESSNTTLNDASPFSNRVGELLNPCRCTTGGKCVCYHSIDDDSSIIEDHSIDDDSSIIESHCNATSEDYSTNSLSSIQSYEQPIIPQEPENDCKEPIPLEPEHNNVFTNSSRSCPSAMASGSCCGTSTTELVCRCGTDCSCEGCGTHHTLTITPSKPLKNCCSNNFQVINRYEHEVDDDEESIERDVTS